MFNLVFESDPGWILDFSNRTLSAFFDEELIIDIDDERYHDDTTIAGPDRLIDVMIPFPGPRPQAGYA